jgi:putative SOS response-associated peptidase YedK
MCGRFNLTAPGELIAEEFDLDEAPLLKPRFNIAPSQPIVTIDLLPGSGRRRLLERSWGLVLGTAESGRSRAAEPRDPQGDLFPDLVRPPEAGRHQINARSETAARSPAFREAFASRRCLIPATGFYEWRKASGTRPQPWLFQMADGRPFAFAGLWQPAQENGAPASCLILTTEPNALAREVHDRMPAILAPQGYTAWLDPAATSATQLGPLLRPYPPEAMSAFPVSPAVNNPATDDPSCIEPIPRDRA